MKRGAENQLIKEDESDDEVKEVPSQGFKKADDATLASRPMRELPKRTLASAPPLGTTSTQKFTGFTGFGAPSPTSTPFSSKPPAPAAASIPVAATASNAAKSFASFLSNASPSTDVPHAQKSDVVPLLAPIPQEGNSSRDISDEAAVDYYKSLRGLNVSFLAAVSKVTEEDPFKDVTELLESYKNLRLKIQKDYDDRPKLTIQEPPKASTIAPTAPATMPTPPAKFAGFNSVLSSVSPKSEGSTVGFNPQSSQTTVTGSSSGFSFGAIAPATTTANTATGPASTGTFSFAAPPPSQSAAKNPFALSASSALSSPFSTPAFGNTIATSTSSPFGAPPKFPLSSSTSNLPFSSNMTSVPNPRSSIFGDNGASSSTTPATPATNIFGSVPSSSSSPKPNAFGGFGGFGKAPGAGNIGNPVGFGFGSPSKTLDTAESSSSFTKEVNKESEASSEGNNENQDVPPPKAPSFSLIGTGPHDVEGEGEENENTVHTAAVKVHRLKKTTEKGEAGWLEIGYGMLRVKKHKETDARRILLRNSSTGKIILNFNLYAGLRVNQSKKTLTLVGHDEKGVSQTYSIRLANEEAAQGLKSAIDSEIAKLP